MKSKIKLLKQEQEKNAKELSKIINSFKEVTPKAIMTVEDELKDRKLSQDSRQRVNKWLRGAYAILEEPKEEKRGKKAPEVEIKELRNDTKELVIKVQKYADQQMKQKKSVVRMLSAKRTLQRLLKHQLTE